MEHQKIINLLDNTWNKPNKFGTKNWVEINDDACGTYNTNSQIKLKPSMFDTYIPMSGTTTVAALEAGERNNNIQVVFKNWLHLLIS